MTRRALVLGSGGTVGIAWETGLLKGLQNAGVDVSNADLIIGTSAGSVVGTQVALDMPLDMLVAMQLAPLHEVTDQPAQIDVQTWMAVVGKLTTVTESTPDVRAQIGKLAPSAQTVSEAEYLTRFDLLRGVPWPDRELLITAVEAESGEFVTWDRTSGAPLVQAVASSCCVPGIFPPVTINGRRYIDGGMRSGTNADLARGYDTVLIIAPIGSQAEGTGLGAQGQIAREIAALRESGSTVELILPDSEAIQVFGTNLMDTTRRIDAAQAGIRQGSTAAETVRAVWNT